ncbi:actin-related protein 5 [Asbolus verrucosus]|uniref:Actin-related protein 5 n=1 Tax=Asbolus verrucosus TaxID=1661398 RepID=A0A482VYL7_ASBVE|nr:actin-related protein 5 [Asbolus verrucosus]
MEILEFKDQKCTPDIIHPYTPTLRNNGIPIVIDNGSYQCRAGWATSSEPLLLFKNLIAKPRKERSKKDTVESTQAPQLQVGNDIINIEAVRFQLKTQFDRNVVTHFEAQEHLFDYTFTHLGIDTENCVPHPIILTEAILNPNSSRQLMSELLFECYSVPGIAYGIDCLYAYHFNEAKPQENALIVNVGYHTCNIVPVIVEQQKERKRELARRLTEINARKREERLIEDEEKLSQLLYIQEMTEAGVDKEEIEKACAEYQIKNTQDLQKHINNLNVKIEKTKQKIIAANTAEEVEEPPTKQPKLNKMVFENEKAMHLFIQNAKKMRQDILNKKMTRKQRKQDMAKRRTAAGQERMRIISQLARKEKGNDDFGLRDEDWDIYKAISKDGGDSDSEAENEKLLELDDVIRAHEPTELDETSNPGETHQLHVGIERYRAPELLFKPYMLGSSDAGLSEVIGYVLSLFNSEDQLKLAENVVIMGGLANLPGLQERILSDLISIRPFQSIVNVRIVKNPSLGAWYGARKWAKSSDLKGNLLTKRMYEEFGPEYFKIHTASNPFYPMPKGQEVEIDVS